MNADEKLNMRWKFMYENTMGNECEITVEGREGAGATIGYANDAYLALHIVGLHNELLEKHDPPIAVCDSCSEEFSASNIGDILILPRAMFCVDCKIHLDFGNDTKYSAIDRAVKLGWRYEVGGWTCPDCIEKQEEEEEQTNDIPQ